ncbi:hypothetical protein [Helicobacter sp.]|uniref:hypothetical protein n=2 Tax=unclassified Helicobacter TaxID=2593540 RepID=UPI002586D19F|nr:hypothetical protein [Helicobacter sp.]MCI7765501.1 hypothetical protein [Helicobacter sp.]
MSKYNVVLLGGSNSMMKNGIKSGLEQDNVHLTNLALGASGSLQNLYELKLPRNQKAIMEADTIITESNINDIENLNAYAKLKLEVVIASIAYLYNELSKLSKKVLVLILPLYDKSYSDIETINNAHRYWAKKHGFNVIDMHGFYEEKNVMDFYMQGDKLHQINPIMKTLGQNIASYLDLLKGQKNTNITETQKMYFTILSPKDMEGGEELEVNEIKNSVFCEKAFKIDKDIELKFKEQYYNTFLVGIHTWNNEKTDIGGDFIASKMRIKTKDSCIIKGSPNGRIFHTINPILIDSQVTISLANKNTQMTEGSEWLNTKPKKILDYCNLVDFFVVSCEKLEYESFLKEDIKIEKEYDFNFLIPDVVFIKEAIEEYCGGIAGSISYYLLLIKLGEAVLKAPKRWYKGGYLWLWYKVYQIKKKYAKELKERE